MITGLKQILTRQYAMGKYVKKLQKKCKVILLKYNTLIYKLGSPIIYFISTAFLASILADTGFKIWQKMHLCCAFLIWILYLSPVIFGYYIGALLDTLEKELILLLNSTIEPDSTIIAIRNTR